MFTRLFLRILEDLLKLDSPANYETASDAAEGLLDEAREVAEAEGFEPDSEAEHAAAERVEEWFDADEHDSRSDNDNE